jgi:hypothetical protein
MERLPDTRATVVLRWSGAEFIVYMDARAFRTAADSN